MRLPLSPKVLLLGILTLCLSSLESHAEGKTKSKTKKARPQSAEAVEEANRSHRGTVAVFGPFYFQERYDLIVTGGTDREKLVANSTGMFAGMNLEYQFLWATMSFDVGMFGVISTVKNAGTPVHTTYSNTGLVGGVLARSKLLARLGPIDVGPTLPFIFRYANNAQNVTGKPDTHRFQWYLGAGAMVSYDFGSFRIDVEGALVDFKHPMLALQAQFEL